MEIVAEGSDGIQDDFSEAYAKLIEHFQLIKTMTLTAEMAEDSEVDMAFTSITDDDLTGKGTVGMADTPNLTAPEMQAKFDELPNLVINKFKTHITEESLNTAASNTGAVDPTTGGEATNIQGVLDNLQTKKQEKETGKGLSANDFTDTYRQELDTAFENTHTHTNKGVLDLITSAVKTAYDRLVTLFTNITSITTTVNGSDTALPTAGAISRYVQQMGGGDMVKSIYDTDNDGIVDHAICHM